MATSLTLSASTCYKGTPSGGYSTTSTKRIGSEYTGTTTNTNHLLRYSFTTPASGYITSLTYSTTLRYYSGPTGYTRPIRVKVTQDSSFHAALSCSTTDYDASYTYSIQTGDVKMSVTITGLKLSPNQTYYIYVFPGSGFKSSSSNSNGAYMVYCYNNDGENLSSLSYDESSMISSGLVYIDNGSSWDAYEVYIDNGSSWDQYIPYIDDGTNWTMCG